MILFVSVMGFVFVVHRKNRHNRECTTELTTFIVLLRFGSMPAQPTSVL